MRIPVATYRFQLNSNFGFSDAAAVLHYLAELGISDLYASPILTARTGSPHGYDGIDPSRLNPELGDRHAFDSLMKKIRSMKLGWVQDIVPNHMAFDGSNVYLMDLFENGSGSRYFDFFDIDWDHPDEGLRGGVAAPFLGKSLAEAVRSGEIRLSADQSGLSIDYYQLKFPVRLQTYPFLLISRLEAWIGRPDIKAEDRKSLGAFLTAVRALETGPETSGGAGTRRDLKDRFRRLHRESSVFRGMLGEMLREINGPAAEPLDRPGLQRLLEQQIFRFTHWKTAAERINYRRFFTINDLISLNVEKKTVFDEIHAVLFRLAGERLISGFRIDHIDGLAQPLEYLARLRKEAGDVYLVVEKILERDESLPADWPVEGTTGYDFMVWANNLFCRPESETAFDRIYSRFSGSKKPFSEWIYEMKRMFLEEEMRGDLDNLARRLDRWASEPSEPGSSSPGRLRRALTEVLIGLPVYRTYFDGKRLSETDRPRIDAAFESARRRAPDLSGELNHLHRLFSPADPDASARSEISAEARFLLRVQQLTGPLTAKGVEDTALYIYNRLVSLNEVGGDPGHFGVSSDEWNRYAETRLREWPLSMNATSTHDVKRGEDVRARLNVLSEIPDEWEARIGEWSELNRGKKSPADGGPAPDPNDEYLLYQTLLGTFPTAGGGGADYLERIQDYMIKAMREAKIHTRWSSPNEIYENAVRDFTAGILHPDRSKPFIESFLPFHRIVAEFGMLNSLSQTLLKITAPGIPDFYQGTELWDLSLVDPDNRRPVDFQKRAAFLRDIREQSRSDREELLRALWEHRSDGRIKLFLIHSALAARRDAREIFEKGNYQPLKVEGDRKGQLLAFARVLKDRAAVVLIPRFYSLLAPSGLLPVGESVWGTTRIETAPLAKASWREVFSGRIFDGEIPPAAAEWLSRFPVGLLIQEDS